MSLLSGAVGGGGARGGGGHVPEPCVREFGYQ